MNTGILGKPYVFCSVSHESFVGPPQAFRAMQAQKRPPATYNYIEANSALPYPETQPKQSEAQV